MSDSKKDEELESDLRPYHDLITEESDLSILIEDLTLNDSKSDQKKNYNHLELRTGLVYMEEMSEHRCLWDENYEESPQRFTQTLKRFKELNLLERCQLLNPRKATEEEIRLIHTNEHLLNMKSTQNVEDIQLLEEKSSNFDAVYFHPKTYDLALYSSGSTIDLVNDIVNGKIRNGFALVRPPGHHAMASEPCGYCIFNNVAIAAAHCLNNLNVERILIVDWDVHHGQATQQSFYDDKRVLYFSIHRYESGAFWPELIESNYNFIGGENAKGFNINVPLNETGMQNADYLAIWHNILLPIAYEFNPQLVFVSAGFDAAIGCPEGEMCLSPAFYAHLCHTLMPIANGKLCVALEGGYCIPSLAESAALTLRTLLGDPCPLIEELTQLKDSLVSSVLDVICVLRPYWKCLRLQGIFDRHSENESYRKQHLPFLEYKGKMALIEKPNKYPTRDCYPIQDNDQKMQLLNEINRLIAITDLSVKYSRRTCIAYDEEMTKHKCLKTHPERPSRIKSIIKRLKDEKLFDKCLHLETRIATEEELSLVHTKEHIETMKLTEKLSNSELTKLANSYDSIYLTNKTYKSAKVAVGNILQVVDQVLTDKCLNGFACIRPPGHHSNHKTASGFCYFNNVAIAARYAIEKFHKKRILIVDWDVHHGDGTQKIFENDERILYVSLHRYDFGDFFPQTIQSSYNISKNVINIPWNGGPMADWEYLTAFFNVVLPVSYNFNPDLVFISAGFDAAINDPLGEYNLSPQVYGHMTHFLTTLANGKVILTLEGGYNLRSISSAACECVSVLIGNPPNELNLENSGLSESAIETLKSVIGFHSTHWSSLKFDCDLPESLI